MRILELTEEEFQDLKMAFGNYVLFLATVHKETMTDARVDALTILSHKFNVPTGFVQVVKSEHQEWFDDDFNERSKNMSEL